MKPIQSSRRDVGEQDKDSNLKQRVKLSLIVFLVSLSSVKCGHADFWYEDFTDGNLSDSGIDWTLGPGTVSLSDGLELNSPNGSHAGFARAELPVRRRNWSLRTQARLLLDLGIFGAGVDGVDDTFGGASVFGEVALGKGGQLLTDWMETDLHPAEEDVIIQLDTFDDVLSIWAWREGEQPAQDIDPLVESEIDQPAGVPFLWTNSLIHPTSTAQFSWIAISTEHMPTDMPTPLSDMVGDFSGDDVLDITDINLLTAELQLGSVHPQYDLNHSGTVDLEDHKYWMTEMKQTWIGDANLDGEFNSGDLVQVFQSGKFETGASAGWGQGDWNGDQRFNSGDFVAAFQDGGFEFGPRVQIASVPEPTSSVVLLLAFISIARARARFPNVASLESAPTL